MTALDDDVPPRPRRKRGKAAPPRWSRDLASQYAEIRRWRRLAGTPEVTKAWDEPALSAADAERLASFRPGQPFTRRELMSPHIVPDAAIMSLVARFRHGSPRIADTDIAQYLAGLTVGDVVQMTC